MIHLYCDLCGKQTDVTHRISKQVGGQFKLMEVCLNCKTEHEALLASLRENFRRQFGDK
jgi:uncharacterized Zn finger protein